MNVFNLIANGTASKLPLADAGSGQLVARPDSAGLYKQEFSKHLQKLLSDKIQAQNEPMAQRERQEVAAHDRTDRPSEKVTRDARFEVRASRSQKEPAATQNPVRDQEDPLHRVEHTVHEAPVTRGFEATESGDNEASAPALRETLKDVNSDSAGWVALQISSQVQVITVDSPETSDLSLMEFARNMGMTDHTIGLLLGGGVGVHEALSPQALIVPAAESLLSAAETTTLPANTAQVLAWPAGSLLQSLMGKQASNALLHPDSSGLIGEADNLPTALSPFKSNLFEGVHATGIQTNAMAGPNNASTPMTTASTLAVLNMLDAQLTPQAIESLQEEFEVDLSMQTEHRAADGQLLSSWGTKLSSQAGLLTTGTTAAHTFAQSSPMAETYEKLSDKLVTELAARLHQQISDGQWKMKFGLKPASLGAVDIQLEMRDGKLAALFQADNPLTQDLLQNGSQRLKDALHGLGISQTSVQVGQGHAQGHSQGQSQTSSDGAKFGDNRGQTHDSDPNTPVGSGHRRSSDSQFDIYA